MLSKRLIDEFSAQGLLDDQGINRVDPDSLNSGLLTVPANNRLVITTDTLLEGTHFTTGTLPYALGYKSLAVNLSDLAAMGAMPIAISLVLSCPPDAANWIPGFVKGWQSLACLYNITYSNLQACEGDTVITVYAYGIVPVDKKPLLRSGAVNGDLVYVSGYLGDAACALNCLMLENSQAITQKQMNRVAEIRDKSSDLNYLIDQLEFPMPRLALGQSLLSLASACVDVSDGLLADLGHICKKSEVGATINLEDIPYSDAMLRVADVEERRCCALTGGDDYELCFTVSRKYSHHIASYAKKLNLPIKKIGFITDVSDITSSITVLDENNNQWKSQNHGYEHFNT